MYIPLHAQERWKEKNTDMRFFKKYVQQVLSKYYIFQCNRANSKYTLVTEQIVNKPRLYFIWNYKVQYTYATG